MILAVVAGYELWHVETVGRQVAEVAVTWD